MDVETDYNSKYFIREIQLADGYITDNIAKTFNIEYDSNSKIIWKDMPIPTRI